MVLGFRLVSHISLTSSWFCLFQRVETFAVLTKESSLSIFATLPLVDRCTTYMLFISLTSHLTSWSFHFFLSSIFLCTFDYTKHENVTKLQHTWDLKVRYAISQTSTSSWVTSLLSYIMTYATMVLNWPIFSLMSLIQVFLYADVYCSFEFA